MALRKTYHDGDRVTAGEINELARMAEAGLPRFRDGDMIHEKHVRALVLALTSELVALGYRDGIPATGDRMRSGFFNTLVQAARLKQARRRDGAV